MCGFKLLGQVLNASNRSFNQGKFDSNFGNVFLVCLFGDQGQLPPVLDIPLYIRKTLNDGPSILGQMIYKSFKKIFFLKQSKRQGQDTELGSFFLANERSIMQ